MNKKILIKFVALIIIVFIMIIIWLFVSFWNTRKENLQQTGNTNSQYPTARDAANWNEPFLKKIEVEFMEAEEKKELNVANDPAIRLQVLERGENGEVKAYKKVYSNNDIVEYIYDPSGAGSPAVQTIPAASSTASGSPIINN